MMARFSDVLGGRDNNLNLIRMVAASAVLVSHAFPIAWGPGTEEPLEHLTGMSLGGLAVAVFFALSGLLIARSFDRRPSMTRFVVARILRLFPALAVVLGLTVFAGLWFTKLDVGQYLSSIETFTYFPRNFTLMFMQYDLPGVFERNAYPGAINGSLWTLFYEVVCYGGVVILGLLGFLKRKSWCAIFLCCFSLLFLWGLTWTSEGGPLRRADLLIQLGFPFALGIMAYVWRERLILSWQMALFTWVLCIPAYGTVYMPFFVVVALSYTVAWVAFVPKGRVLRYNQIGDYSYGVYIYAFPTQQAMSHFFPNAGPYFNMALSFPIVICLAALSWHLVEKKALGRVEWLAERIQARARPALA